MADTAASVAGDPPNSANEHTEQPAQASAPAAPLRALPGLISDETERTAFADKSIAHVRTTLSNLFRKAGVEFSLTAAVPKRLSGEWDWNVITACSPRLSGFQSAIAPHGCIPEYIAVADHQCKLAAARKQPFSTLRIQLIRRATTAGLSVLMPQRKQRAPFEQQNGTPTLLSAVKRQYPWFPANKFDSWYSPSRWSLEQHVDVAKAMVSQSAFTAAIFPRIAEKAQCSAAEQEQLVWAYRQLRREQRVAEQPAVEEADDPMPTDAPPELPHGIEHGEWRTACRTAVLVEASSVGFQKAQGRMSSQFAALCELTMHMQHSLRHSFWS